jgi:hypothetical protein
MVKETDIPANDTGNSGAKEELLNKNGGNFQGVPVTDINGELVLGFDRPKLQDLLRKNGLLAD